MYKVQYYVTFIYSISQRTLQTLFKSSPYQGITFFLLVCVHFLKIYVYLTSVKFLLKALIMWVEHGLVY